ncbi:MAG TPA: MmgE/PrpD family protein [Streptosporangiaceae bacterium]|nr:MmgE/PrpD family protein [Streptosporangiaceae bacterium]
MPSNASTSIAASLADWLVSTPPGDIPAEVMQDATWRLVDQIGVGLAGVADESAQIVARLTRQRGGTPEATVIGFGGKYPAAAAGWTNGAIGHVTDYDDMHGVAAVHISSVAVPAALAAAEAAGASGLDTLAALSLGAEVALRIATGAPPHQFHHRGLHGTGVAGPFAAAAIAAKISGLGAEQATNALGMAGSRSSGLMQTLIDGSWVKRLHPGWAVEGGLTCAALAADGYTGPREVVEGTFGFFHALLHGDEQTFQFDQILDGLGSRWLLPDTTYKPWPNGVWNHASMDGAAAIVSREGLAVADIERIDCHVPPICIPIVCEPRAAKLNLNSPYHAKFSLQYSVAMLLINGYVSVDDYTDALLANPAYAELAGRVFCHADEAMAPDFFPARVELTTKDGRRYVEDVPAQRGTSRNPMTPADHRAKFMANASPRLGTERADRLRMELEHFRELDSIAHVLELTVPEAATVSR